MAIHFSRRHLIARAGLISLAGATAALQSAPAWAALALTPRQTTGPFYPPALPFDKDNDLTFVEGRPGSAVGTIANIGGQVTDTDGRRQAGALVEIWQANAFGRYHHPSDRSSTPIDPNFQGYGQTVTDAQGLYRFRTIRPAPYPGRTPHIHFAVKPLDAERLVTQMYFAGEPDNERDGILQSIRDPAERARLIVPLNRAEQEPGTLEGIFDIVLGA